jgi:hypothetical protein
LTLSIAKGNHYPHRTTFKNNKQVPAQAYITEEFTNQTNTTKAKPGGDSAITSELLEA